WAGSAVGAATVRQVGLIDKRVRFWLARTVDGAVTRLGRTSCRQVLADFVDAEGATLTTRFDNSGRSIESTFDLLRFVDDRSAQTCSNPSIAAFTTPGSRVIHICWRRFADISAHDQIYAEFIVIHEFLHTLGLGENPPSAGEIT